MKKLLSKISVAAFIAAMSLICGCSNPGTSSSTPDSTPSACEHTGGTATCTEKAICETCGEAYGEALGHEAAAEWTITTEATCVAKGEQVKTCTREGCGEVVETEEIAINPDNHTAAEEWTTKTEATCVAKGEKVKLCTNEGCGAEVETEEIAIDPTNHAPAAEWTTKTPATCVAKGEKVKTCTNEGCGAEVETEEIAIDPTNHAPAADWTTKTEATCVAAGEEVKNCTREGCGAQVESQPIAINPNNHAGEWETIYEASCTGAGEKTFDCTREGCEYTATEYPAALPHNYNKTTLKCENFEECYSQYEKQVPVVDKAYLFGMTQGNKNNEVYYIKGGMDGFYMATTTNPNEALKVYLEETEGGYYAYCYVDEVKTYINMVVNGTHVNGAYEATASTVYTINAECYTITAKVNDTDYWFGTRDDKTFTTVGPIKTFYNGAYDGFYCEFYGIHDHEYTIEGDIIIEATSCADTNIVDTGKGQKEMKCSCGAVAPMDYYLDHIDENLDIKCDRTHQKLNSDGTPAVDAEGNPVMKACGGRIWPEVNTEISYTTAGAMKTFSAGTRRYYVTGTIEIIDGVNIVITDGNGNKLLIYNPEDKAGDEGVVFTKWANIPVVGDKVKVEGFPTQITSGSYKDVCLAQFNWTKDLAIMTILDHTHNFGEATCSAPSTCPCKATQGEALPHTDTADSNNFCDVCGRIIQAESATLKTTADGNGDTPVDDGTNSRTWSNDVFSVAILKGTASAIYTDAAYTRVRNGNKIAISTKDGQAIKQIVLDGSTTTSSNLKKIIDLFTAAGHTAIISTDGLSAIITLSEPTSSIELTVTSATAGRFSGMTIYY